MICSGKSFTLLTIYTVSKLAMTIQNSVCIIFILTMASNKQFHSLTHTSILLYNLAIMNS